MRLGASRALLALTLCAACFGGGPAPVAATSAQPSNEEIVDQAQAAAQNMLLLLRADRF